MGVAVAEPSAVASRRAVGARLRSERGSALVIFAFVVPLILILGTLAVDVGNWFTHKRHLQTQADAAAFAGGSRWGLPCLDAVNQAIVDTARQYAGPSASGNTGPYNPQVSATPSANLHVLLNSTGFYGEPGSGDFTDSTNPADPSLAQPCVKDYLDVKVTEKDLPWLFNWFGSGVVPTINARARVKILPVVAERGFLPLAVPDARIYQARATILSCGQVLGSVPLGPLPAGQNVPNLVLWGPVDASGNPITSFPITKPNFAVCSGKSYMPIDVNIEVSGAPPDPNAPQYVPNLANCPNKFVDCFDTQEIRVWKPGGSGPAVEGAAPIFDDVKLTDVTCGPGSPYWSSGETTTLACATGISAVVNWGTLPSLHSGFQGQITARAGGGTVVIPCNASGVCSAPTGLTSGDGTTGNEPQNVTLDWEYWYSPGGGVSCRANSHRTCTGTGVVVHRANALGTTPVGRVITYPAGSIAPVESVSYDSFPTSITVSVGLTTSLRVGQQRVLRLGTAQGNQTIQCDPDYTNGFDVTALALGCKPLYGRNTVLQGWSSGGMTWEPCPTPTNTWFAYPQVAPAQIWYCTLAGPGLSPNQVADGAAITTKNCTSIQYAGSPPLPKSCSQVQCLHPNYWSLYGTGQSNDPALNPTDPRIVTLFVVPYAALKTANANDPIEVVDFAKYYVTGWAGQGGGGSNQDPCLSNSPADESTGAGSIIGRFIAAADQNQSIPDPNGTCDPNSPRPCTVVLVR